MGFNLQLYEGRRIKLKLLAILSANLVQHLDDRVYFHGYETLFTPSSA